MGAKERDPEAAPYTMLNLRKDHAKSFTERQKGALGVVDNDMQLGIVQHVMKHILITSKNKSMP
jgi:hypothetical protein